MNEHEQEPMERLLRRAMLPVPNDVEWGRDLWPEMLRKLDEKPMQVPWFDWALAGGVLGLMALFPASIPMLLYCM
jgi:hypothetical protein